MPIRNITEVNVELIPEVKIQTDEIISNEDIFSQTLANYTTSYSKWIDANLTANDNTPKRSTKTGGQAAKPVSGGAESNPNWFISSQATYVPGTIELEDQEGSVPDLSILDDAIILTPFFIDTTSYPMELELEEIHFIKDDLDTSDSDSTSLSLLKTDDRGRILNKDNSLNMDGKVSYRSGVSRNLMMIATEVKQTNAPAEKRIYTNTIQDKVTLKASSTILNTNTPNIWSTNALTGTPVNIVTTVVDKVKEYFNVPKTTATVQSVFEQTSYGNLWYEGTYWNSSTTEIFPMGALQSKFYLRKNQPFVFNFSQRCKSDRFLHDAKMNKDVTMMPIDNVLGVLNAKTLKPIFHVPDGSTIPDNSDTIIIEWGKRDKKTRENKFCLVFDCRTSEFSLYVETEKTKVDQAGNKSTSVEYVLVGKPAVLEGVKGYDYFRFMIYPLGNKIILKGRGTATKKENSNTISFDFGEAIFIGESKINLFLYGMHGTAFSFNAVTHRPFGLLASNFKSYKTEEPTFYLKAKYLGGVGLSPLDSISKITYPVLKDTQKLYSYLSQCWINYTFGTLKDAGYTNLIDSTSKDTEQLSVFDMYMVSNKNYYTVDSDPNIEWVNRFNRYYSPAIYSANLMIVPPVKTVNLIDTGNTVLSYVRNVNITQTIEGYSGSITLYNKSMDRTQRDGTYTNDYRIQGIKPVKIEAKIKTDAEVTGGDGFTNETNDPTSGKMNRLFTGYITSRNFSRSSGKNAKDSTVTLTLEDATLRAKDTYIISMPPFDGYCHLAAFYYLAKYAGYSDDEILLWQDYYDSSLKIRICDQLSGGQASANVYGGGCFEGHVDGFPRGELKRLRNASVFGASTGTKPPTNSDLVGISGEQLHACLPMTLITESPGFFFQMGTPVWNAMQEICEFTGFYLFANNWGNLIYCPPELALSPYIDFEFVELPGDASFENITKFNEILQVLAVDHPTAEVRNACMTQGLLLEGNNTQTPNISPIVSVKVQDGWPDNVKDENYIPWLRWIVQRNPHWNDIKRLAWNNEQTLLRAVRKRSFGKWSAWGRGIYPYQILQISETHLKETGMDQERYICSSVNHTLDGENMQWNISIDAERYEKKFEFSPHFK